MNTTIEMFIGENNRTHKVDRDLIIQTLSKYHEGFTIQPAVGYWHGVQENSVAVIISDDSATIFESMKKLKYVLKQEAIAYHEVAPLEFA